MTFASSEFLSYDEYNPLNVWAIIGAVSGFFGTVAAAWEFTFPPEHTHEDQPILKQRRLNPKIGMFIDGIYDCMVPSVLKRYV